MRVLIIGTDRSYFDEQSLGDAVSRHIKYAERAGDVDIIVVGKGAKTYAELSPHLHAYLTGTSKIFHLWGVLRVAKKLFSENVYDLIVSQELSAPAGEMLKKRYGVPLIIGIHSMFYKRGLFSFNILNQLGVLKIKRSLTSADAFRVNNAAIEAWLRSRGLTQQPILVQPTPVAIEKFFVPSKPQSSVPTILYVGRLSPEKNIELLIRSVRQLQHTLRLQIVGGGVERRRLEKLSDNDKRIQFFGSVDHDKLTDFYREAAIFVLPSNSESFGKVLIEAGASQCAIVSTKTVGALSILTDQEDALLVEVEDAEGIRTAIEKLLVDQSLREKLGQAAQHTASRYDAEEASSRIVDFWKEIVRTA